MTNIVLVAIAALLGYLYRDIRDKVKYLQTNLPKEKPDIGATPASYGTTRGYASQDSPIGLVNTKTPEQLEWEHRQEISKDMS